MRINLKSVLGFSTFVIILLFNNCGGSGGGTSSSQNPSGNLTIICSRDTYNCPGYSGPNQHMRLPSCQDVAIVWATCGSDPHGLDNDGDGIPCNADCN